MAFEWTTAFGSRFVRSGLLPFRSDAPTPGCSGSVRRERALDAPLMTLAMARVEDTGHV